MTSTGQFQDRHWRSRDGLELHARQYGQANGRLPVVCIPGLTRNARDFEDAAPWMAARGRLVLAVDLRGRAGSEPDPKRRYNPRVYADDMVALLEAIGEPKAIFIGTSLGGLVTMALAASRPDAIGGAVLNDVGPKIGKAGYQRIGSYAGKGAPVRTWEDAAAYAKRTNGIAFPHYDDGAWMKVARRTFRDDDGTPVLDYDPFIFSRPSRLLVWLTQPLVWAAFRKLARIEPLALIHGGTTDILEPDTIAKMRRIAPHMSVVPVPGVGHAPMLDEPAALDGLAAFLDGAP